MRKISAPFKVAMTFAIILSTQHIAQAANIGDIITGGVGKDEMQRIENMQNDYNLKLTFAAANGHYLSDVKVQISDANGQNIINTTTEGPILLAKFSPGKYTITATNAGGTKTQTVTVGSGMKKLGIVLPEADRLSENSSVQQYLEDKGYAVDLAFPA